MGFLSLYFVVLKTDFCEEEMTVLMSKTCLLYGLSFLLFCCFEDRFLWGRNDWWSQPVCLEIGGGCCFLLLLFLLFWWCGCWFFGFTVRIVFTVCVITVWGFATLFFPLSFLRREAVALARVRLSPLDPVLEDLYTDWSEQLMRDGAYEQAAKWYGLSSHWLTDGRALTVIGLLMVGL